MTNPLVVMGVSGSGKTTLGRELAAALGWRFVEGDGLHPPANVAKMAAGRPLDDADRMPFLEAVGKVLAEAREEGVVVSCSALKRSYRDLIRERAGAIRFVLPVLDRQQLVARLARREGHFMPLSLLDSQLATLEEPMPEEGAILVDGTASIAAQVRDVLAALRAASSSATHG